jgi:hypothetical protein
VYTKGLLRWWAEEKWMEKEWKVIYAHGTRNAEAMMAAVMKEEDAECTSGL